MNAIEKIVMYAGTAVKTSLVQLILATCCIIKKPTIISAGAVANAGIAKNIGDRNSDTANRQPAVTAVKPVLPPSAMPADDSTKVVIVDVPKSEPVVVPIASVNKTCLTFGNLPSASKRFAFDAQPITVPIVSNRSTNRNAINIEKNSNVNTPLKSTCKNVGASDAGIDTTPDGNKLKNPFSGFGTYNPTA